MAWYEDRFDNSDSFFIYAGPKKKHGFGGTPILGLHGLTHGNSHPMAWPLISDIRVFQNQGGGFRSTSAPAAPVSMNRSPQICFSSKVHHNQHCSTRKCGSVTFETNEPTEATRTLWKDLWVGAQLVQTSGHWGARWPSVIPKHQPVGDSTNHQPPRLIETISHTETLTLCEQWGG